MLKKLVLLQLAIYFSSIQSNQTFERNYFEKLKGEEFIKIIISKVILNL